MVILVGAPLFGLIMNNNLLITIIAAFILMLLVAAALGIGWLLSGKDRLRKGCGWKPKDKDSKTCDICGAKKKCDSDDDNDSEPRPDND